MVRCKDAPLPRFAVDELQSMVRCGDFEHGFLRFNCRRCGEELRVPFSCKARGTCPSCRAKRHHKRTTVSGLHAGVITVASDRRLAEHIDAGEQDVEPGIAACVQLGLATVSPPTASPQREAMLNVHAFGMRKLAARFSRWTHRERSLGRRER